MSPPWRSKFFQFHTVFEKIWQNRILVPPPGELAPPPRGNPGSATGRESDKINNFKYPDILPMIVAVV